MATIPPPPTRSNDFNDIEWQTWFRRLKSATATVIDNPTVDNFVTVDANGQFQDSGYDHTSFVKVNGTQDIEMSAGESWKVGDGTNSSEFEEDGTLKFNGTATVWNDANVGALSLTLPVATQPDEVNFIDELGADTGITTWGFAVGEKVSGVIEFPHDYKEGSDIIFHVHWQGTAAPAGGTDNVQWQLSYTVSRDGSTLDAKTTIVKETAITTRYSFSRSEFPTITGTNFKIGDQFLFVFSRIAASGDEYAGDALTATLGFHYECDTVGSRGVTTK